MRTMLTVKIPVETGNKSIKDGTLPKVMEKFIETHKPEAAYFLARNGQRCAHFVFDLKDPSNIVMISEPFFMELGAEVEYHPVMNAEDLKKGLEATMAAGARR